VRNCGEENRGATKPLLYITCCDRVVNGQCFFIRSQRAGKPKPPHLSSVVGDSQPPMKDGFRARIHSVPVRTPARLAPVLRESSLPIDDLCLPSSWAISTGLCPAFISVNNQSAGDSQETACALYAREALGS
jgi:hypothetical protein